jgi:hypothetical protein
VTTRSRQYQTRAPSEASRVPVRAARDCIQLAIQRTGSSHGPGRVCVRLRHNPVRRVRDTHIEHFSGANHVIKCSHHLLDRRHEISGVNPLEVNVIGLEPIEAGLKSVGHILAVIAARVGIAFASEERVLRRDNEVVPVGRNEFPRAGSHLRPRYICWRCR